MPPSAAAAATGLAFALTLTSGGTTLSSDRFVLRAPGLPGAVVLTLDDPGNYGSTFASPVRVKNETTGDLLAVSAEVASVTETRRDPAGAESTREHASGEGPAPAWERVPKGGESDAQLLRAGPVDFGEETLYVTLLGRLHGVADLGGFTLEGAPHPEALAAEPNGTLWVRDASGTVVRTDGAGAHPVVQGRMPEPRTSPACAGERACAEAPDGSVWRAAGSEITIRDPDGGTRRFAPGGSGKPAAIAFGKDGRAYVAAEGAIRVFRGF